MEFDLPDSVRYRIVQGRENTMAFRKTLLERRKGRQMHASGTWKTTRREDLIIKGTGLFFAASVITVLVSSFLHITALLVPAVICLDISFIGMFVVLFGIAFLKARKEPMEKHYYTVDYRYNGITGEAEDNGREISREEFLGIEQGDGTEDKD